MPPFALHADRTLPAYAAEANGRDLPWNVMGTQLSVAAETDYRAALAESGLDYDVTTVPSAGLVDGQWKLDNAAFKIVRPVPDGGVMFLGAGVGSRYTTIQNRDAFAVAETLVADHGAKISGMADFRNGSASVLSLELGGFTIDTPDGHVDTSGLFLLIKNTHDGSGALTFALTPVRFSCTNALQMAVASAQRVWKMSHTPKAAGRIELANTAVLRATGYLAKVEAEAQRLLNTAMSDREFDKIIDTMWAPSDARTAKGELTKAALDRTQWRSTIRTIYAESESCAHIRGTRWGGYNAITEALDHNRPVRAKGDLIGVARAEGALDGPIVRIKDQVWKTFSQQAPKAKTSI